MALLILAESGWLGLASMRRPRRGPVKIDQPRGRGQGQFAIGVEMADFLNPEERSERMARIRSQDTKPELLVRKALHKAGFRFRLHRRDLPGRPDLILPKYQTAVFVEGCFWHGHHCQKGRIPATNSKFWQTKIQTNKLRDRRNQRALRRAGWRVLRVWECQLTSLEGKTRAIQRLIELIRR